MFHREIYESRREVLGRRLSEGLVVLAGHQESPVNFRANCYPFRQDSTFLYYVGLDRPDLVAVVDTEGAQTTLYGDESTLDDIVWTGHLPTLAEQAEAVGITRTRPLATLRDEVATAIRSGRGVAFLPPYRAETIHLLSDVLGIDTAHVTPQASVDLIRAVADQRSRKGPEELAEIERAVAVSVDMHVAAMRMAAPGVSEREIAAEVARIADASGGRLAYPSIATVEGQTLHNNAYVNELRDGDLFLLDAGAETAAGYAGDLTSTFPVARDFTGPQRDIHEIVMEAYRVSVDTVAPGVPNRAGHFAAARVVFEGMKSLGLMRGDHEEAIEAGAHALVFPHGIGHLLGLDVHDMESFGEEHVGYDGEARSEQFGLRYLRLARPLEEGFVLTIEPGVYFIPQLIDDWRARNHCAEFVNFERLDRWRGFGGFRNEENFLVTLEGARRLGPRKPQTEEEIRTIRDGTA